MTIPPTAAQLGLERHPEGGWYRRTYTSPIPVETEKGTRPAVTLIHFFLSAGDTSAWHVVTSDEIWLWHGPGTLQIQFGGTHDQPDAAGEAHRLGGGTEDVAQVLVPAGVWQRTLPADDDVLVSCLVSPGFSFDDWSLASGNGDGD